MLMVAMLVGTFCVASCSTLQSPRSNSVADIEGSCNESTRSAGKSLQYYQICHEFRSFVFSIVLGMMMSQTGMSALHEAALENRLAAFQLLLELGASDRVEDSVRTVYCLCALLPFPYVDWFCVCKCCSILTWHVRLLMLSATSISVRCPVRTGIWNSSGSHCTVKTSVSGHPFA